MSHGADYEPEKCKDCGKILGFAICNGGCECNIVTPLEKCGCPVGEFGCVHDDPREFF